MIKKMLTVFAFVFFLFLFACNEQEKQGDNGNNENETNEFSVLESDLSLAFKQSYTLNVTKPSKDAIISFMSDDDMVCEVDSGGNLIANGAGETVITITDPSGNELFVNVNVLKPEIKIDENKDITTKDNRVLKLWKNYECDEVVEWYTSSNSIASIDEKGFVTFKKEGEVTITAYARTSKARTTFTFNVIKVYDEPNDIMIDAKLDDELYINSTVYLNALVLPESARQEVIWTSSNPDKALIDDYGTVTLFKGGDITFKCVVKDNKELKSTYSIHVNDFRDPEIFINSIVIDTPLNDVVRCFGFGPIKASDGLNQIDYNTVLAGSVTLVNWGELVVNTSKQRQMDNPTVGRDIRYICVHDTATTHSTNTAYNLANNQKGNNSFTWHYSCGSGVAFRSNLDSEIGAHAGDGMTSIQTFTDTSVKAIGTEPAWISISDDGYWEFTPFFRGSYDKSLKVKSNIAVPAVPIETYKDGKYIATGYRQANNSDLPNDTSITNIVGENGNYWIGNPHWDSTYKTLANYGGNVYSIGIESCVNYGCDLYRVWMTLAKLIGTKLLPDNNLTPNAVKQHNTFSGKNCPETMRTAKLWPYFMDMVRAEYELCVNFKDFKFTFIKGNTDLINEAGQIVKWPDTDTDVTYQIRVTSNDGTYNKTFRFTSRIPAKQENVKLVDKEDPYYYMTQEARNKQMEHAYDK